MSDSTTTIISAFAFINVVASWIKGWLRWGATVYKYLVLIRESNWLADARLRKVGGVFQRINKLSPFHKDMRWIEKFELRRVVALLVRLLGFKQGPWMVLAQRLHRLWQLSGTKFLIAYIKECRLAIIARANSSLYIPNPNVRVRIRPSGWPSIVPAGLRVSDCSTGANRATFRGLHTVFNLYRVMDFKGAIPDFSSITNRFTGVSEVLFPKEVSHVLGLLPHVKFPKGVTSPWVNTSAGPNHPWSTWSSGKDALAWALAPHMYVAYFVYALATSQVILAVWLGILTTLLLPIAIGLRFRKVQLHLGRLAVLAKDGGGKRRIVGVVDFWSQWLLKSLHNYVFDILRRIPQDGTFDQLGPLQFLIDFARLGHPAYSFDLSNATDRLPVKLQEQVLSGIIGAAAAWAWRVLLTHRVYHHAKAGELRYSVGQPIGCLSSWAILALTHHVIVQVAAYRTGYTGWYPFYALLGDDIVILGTRVAEEYLSIIRYLGVPINMMKSISSEKGLLEFAKRVVSAHHGDLSPISGRNLLRTVRSPNLVADLLVHVIDLGFLPFPNQVREILQRLKPQLSKTLMRDELLVIARAYVLRRYQGVSRLPSANWQDEWFLSLLGLSVPVTSLVTSLQVLLRINSIGAFEADCRRAVIQFDHFIKNWWRIPLFEGTLGGILSIPLIVASPAFWSYFLTFLSSLSRLDEIGKPIYWDMLAGCIGISWKGIFGSVLLELDFNYGESELDSSLSNPVAIPEMVVKQVRRPSLSDMLVLVTDLRSFVRAKVGSPPRKLRLRTHIEALPAPKAD